MNITECTDEQYLIMKRFITKLGHRIRPLVGNPECILHCLECEYSFKLTKRNIHSEWNPIFKIGSNYIYLPHIKNSDPMDYIHLGCQRFKNLI